MSLKAEIKILKDESGVPSIVEVTRRGKTLKYEVTPQGFDLIGPPSILPDIYDIMPLIFPIQKETVFKIPEPLQVTQVSGGKTVFFDDMEGLLKWVTNATTAIDNTNAFNGSNSLKITVPAPAGTANNTVRNFGLPFSRKVGFSCWFAVDDFTKFSAGGLNFQLVNHDGILESDGYLRYDAINRVWQTYNQNGVYQNIPDSTQAVQYQPLTGVGGTWHKIKFVVDFINKEYVSLEVNERKFSITGIKFRSAATASSQFCSITVRAEAAAADEINVWLDDVIVTEE